MFNQYYDANNSAIQDSPVSKKSKKSAKSDISQRSNVSIVFSKETQRGDRPVDRSISMDPQSPINVRSPRNLRRGNDDSGADVIVKNIFNMNNINISIQNGIQNLINIWNS